jgi:hypothetical protein
LSPRDEEEDEDEEDEEEVSLGVLVLVYGTLFSLSLFRTYNLAFL